MKPLHLHHQTVAKDMDMTSGPLLKKLIAVSLPLAFSGILQLLFNAADLIVIGQFAETVSQSRNKWLNEMREFVSDMLANKRREIYGNCNGQNCADVCNKYDTSKFQVLMRLNGNESDHRQLKALILSLDGFDCNTKANGNLEKYKVAEQAILELSTRIFKDEWEKVKIEAKGESIL